MEKKRKFKMSVGVSSMLMIFVILCFTTFGVLSYVTANADARLTQKNQQATEAYYTADARAEDILSALDAQLTALQQSALQQPEPKQAYISLLGSLTVPNSNCSVTMGGAISAYFTVPVDDGRQIEVALFITPDPSAGERYRVTRRALADTREWEESSRLDLWRG